MDNLCRSQRRTPSEHISKHTVITCCPRTAPQLPDTPGEVGQPLAPVQAGAIFVTAVGILPDRLRRRSLDDLQRITGGDVARRLVGPISLTGGSKDARAGYHHFFCSTAQLVKIAMLAEVRRCLLTTT